MRLVTMFDLPTETKSDKRQYIEFRNFLLRDGYDMVQFSVYVRLCRDGDTARRHIERLRKYAPNSGAVRILLITNKQYAEAIIVAGERKSQEKRINDSQLLLF